ncbi:tyrosine-protein phosphatase [Listeria ivanovii]|uniref:tyrosine-protein phosphatase n=1 Tax=Listeria ivanovii TaxID=1638 RepID=UPI000512931B|nr:tyrosine-protein phosphatase [Listeria ivanovii]AIS63161.1 protein tyrosine phosphatase [Listeria ivanovii subsp. londoniensis]MBK1966736.1 tyrosine-protein phosphatase [Listeria ivanovii subsp. londoniensis]MBK1984077.1 tyrosine-protein phosphatase [Listeria ivanovii subsp. londoniensis]MBK1996206.1 tyrosine-protein phosphatase [Listeria ivanovii subsp. londoniensis]MBM5720372.1 tyrosine-protein phosphatase [Listeria ivanovii]
MEITRSNNTVTLEWNQEEVSKDTLIFVNNSPTLESNAIPVLKVTEETNHFTYETDSIPIYFFLQKPDGIRTVISERILPTERIFNFRDMGGYESENGKHVRWGQLYRSSNLVNINQTDIELIQKLHIKWICDLRSSSEVQAQPTPEIAGVLNKHIPIGTAKNEKTEIPEMTDKTIYEPLMGESYRVFVQSIDGFKEIFHEILKDTKAGVPFVFHCTAGKDRTGVLGALLLTLLDVPEKTIFADYAITNRYQDAILQEMGGIVSLFANSTEKIDLETFRPMAEARPAYLEIAFDEMRKQFGSVDNYLAQGIGITAEEKAAFQNLLLE